MFVKSDFNLSSYFFYLQLNVFDDVIIWVDQNVISSKKPTYMYDADSLNANGSPVPFLYWKLYKIDKSNRRG